jgi:hypothetical protein
MSFLQGRQAGKKLEVGLLYAASRRDQEWYTALRLLLFRFDDYL